MRDHDADPCQKAIRELIQTEHGELELPQPVGQAAIPEALTDALGPGWARGEGTDFAWYQ